MQLRDRAMLVVLYSCGLRRTEAVNLNINDILFDKERIHVTKAKNNKERFVPINRKNAEILEDYLYESRPHFKAANTHEAFFINKIFEFEEGLFSCYNFPSHQITINRLLSICGMP